MGAEHHRFETARLSFRPLGTEDCNATYLGWLNDPIINRFLETRHSEQSLESIRAFVEAVNARENEHLFGIIQKTDGAHIGNIKVGPISAIHHRGDVSLFIGERAAWGKGFACEAISGISRFAFDVLGVKKLCSGMYAENQGSFRAFLKAGYKHEGTRRHQGMIDGVLLDILECGLIPDDLK
jgi:[ribosomal protein S5]-alanine N-acetyltransferase